MLLWDKADIMNQGLPDKYDHCLFLTNIEMGLILGACKSTRDILVANNHPVTEELRIFTDTLDRVVKR